MKNTYWIVIVVLIVIVGGYFVLKGQYKTSPSSSTSTSKSDNPPVGTQVSINNMAFSPATVTIKKGATVTWTNNDSVSHTVTSDSSGLFDSSTIKNGQNFSHIFSDTGTFTYHCSFHPAMKGTVVVTD